MEEDDNASSEPRSADEAQIDKLLYDTVEGLDEQIDDPYVDVLAQYVEQIDPKLMRLGWVRKNAKTTLPPFNKYDQSMLSHTRTGVFFLLRFIGDVLDDEFLIGRGERHEVLKELVALFVIHDVHKIRDSSSARDEFEIPRDEIEAFVAELGLDDFAPGLTIDEFHASAVGLHKCHDGTKYEMLTPRFHNLLPFLRLADTIAGMSDAEEVIESKSDMNWYDAVENTKTRHCHKFDETGGLVSVMNKAIAQTFEDYEYELLTVHKSGCTYLSDGEIECGELPDDSDEFIDNIHDSFLTEIRKSFPRYRNRTILSDAAEKLHGHGRYHITNLDILCLNQRDLIRAIVEHGITEANAPFDIPQYTEDVLDVLEGETDIEFDRTFRIEGLARIIHTVYESILPHLDRKSVV